MIRLRLTGDPVRTMLADDATVDQNVAVRQIPLANMHVLRYNTRHPVLQDKKLRQTMNLGFMD